MTKEELRRIEIVAMPPIKRAKEPSIKEKLHFWWADAKFFLGKAKEIVIVLLKAYIAAIVIYVLSYITVRYLHQVLPV